MVYIKQAAQHFKNMKKTIFDSLCKLLDSHAELEEWSRINDHLLSTELDAIFSQIQPILNKVDIYIKVIKLENDQKQQAPSVHDYSVADGTAGKE